jgi:hypothetical protein
MEQKKIHRIFGALLIIIFLTACSAPSPTETQIANTPVPQATSGEIATEPPATAENAAPIAAEGLCINPYYPVREGATWSYKSTGGPAGEYSFTDTIASVRQDGFTLSTHLGDLTRTQEWTCTSEGLSALQLGGAPAAMLNSQNMHLDLDVQNASGVTFPRQMKPGDQWQQSADVKGKASVANEKGEASGTVQMTFAAIGQENVTVPAGMFDALKINVVVTLNLNAAYGGITLPVTFSGKYTYWFVQDVGWVKASGTGNVLGSSFSETTELQSYSLP